MTSLDRGAVCVAYLHQEKVAHSFHKSMLELFLQDANAYLKGESEQPRLLRRGSAPIGDKAHGGDLEGARNRTVEVFLKERDAEWLLWVDDDMGFEWSALAQLLEVADPVERPIVGGLCFAWRERSSDGMSGYQCGALPTIFKWDRERGHFVGHTTFPVNTLMRCHGTGSAFILIHRTVFERMLVAFGPNWYERLPDEAEKQGWVKEDLAFCMRAGRLDIPIYVHTGVKTSHLKPHWVQEHDFWTERHVPPAAERVTVVVPVLGRPQNAEPFMRSLRASTGMADVVAVCNQPATDWFIDEGDDEETPHQYDDDPALIDQRAWGAVGAEVIGDDGLTTFAQKVNLAALDVKTDWIFVTGDDVHFHPGWLDRALEVAHRTGAKVVGTQDLGNPRVLAGDHATHWLISTEYIREEGASWDGPGVVCHEGYHHWFVDDEIVAVAKQRGVWQFAAGSIVEHMHPAWEKGVPDATYELGARNAKKDEQLFRGRYKAYVEVPAVNDSKRLRMGAGSKR